MHLLGSTARFALAALTLYLAVPSGAQVHVNLYNDVGVTGATIENARREADRILLSAGVRLTWSDCRPAEPDSEPCGAPGPATLQLRLYPAAAEAKFPVAPDAFGFALSQPPPNHGFFVGIFHARVEVLAQRDRIKASRLLGHIIAHEIGHLLLGGGGHAADGIMKFPWHGKELDRLQRGALLFLPRQAKVIRGNVEARLSKELPVDTAEWF